MTGDSARGPTREPPGRSRFAVRHEAPKALVRAAQGTPSAGRLDNEIRSADWGSHTAIPELLGLASPAPAPPPCAELWVGACPDVDALLETLAFATGTVNVLRTEPRATGEQVYTTPAIYRARVNA